MIRFTDEQLRRIDPRVHSTYATVLQAAMKEGDISTLPREAAFIAQILHESGGFQYLRELASGSAYEGRTNLGNTQPGDGMRFKGRGFIQLTGRSNYHMAGQDLGLDLEGQPELAERPDIAARIAVWTWTKLRLNPFADVGDFRMITQRINGGLTGLAERTRLYEQAKRIFAEPQPLTAGMGQNAMPMLVLGAAAGWLIFDYARSRGYIRAA